MGSDASGDWRLTRRQFHEALSPANIQDDLIGYDDWTLASVIPTAQSAREGGSRVDGDGAWEDLLARGLQSPHPGYTNYDWELERHYWRRQSEEESGDHGMREGAFP